MIKVSNEIKVYDPNRDDSGLDVSSSTVTLRVESHWNNRDRVVLVVESEGSKTEFAVYAKDLEVAIANARNSNRHG